MGVIIKFGSIFQCSLPGSLPSVASPSRNALALLLPTEEVFLFCLAAHVLPTVVEVVSTSVSPWWWSSESLLSKLGQLLSRAKRAQSIVPWWLSPGGCWEVPASEEDSTLDLPISCITLCGQDMRGSLDSSLLPLELSPCLQPHLRLA